MRLVDIDVQNWQSEMDSDTSDQSEIAWSVGCSDLVSIAMFRLADLANPQIKL